MFLSPAIPHKLPVNTARPDDSVWRYINQENFRKRIHDLKRKNDVPGVPEAHDCQAWQRERSSTHERRDKLLPIEIEEQIANDIAYVAAAQKDVKSVSAAALEEVNNAGGLIVRLTANEAIEVVVLDTLRSIFELLQTCAVKGHRGKYASEIFDKVIHLQRNRIHARLQSKHYEVPEHYDRTASCTTPLSQNLQDLAKYLTSPKNSLALRSKLAELASTYLRADDCRRDTDDEIEILKAVAQQSYNFCTPEGRPIEETISSYGFRGLNVLENKHLRQINKLGRYWGLCKDLAEASRKFDRLFRSIDLQTLPSYEAYLPPSLTKIGRMPYHVHAEIQLLTFYGLQSSSRVSKPRILGVSKSACYLCNLFIINHDQFFITKTHGRLYPLWTVPDRADYSANARRRIRQVLATIDQEIQTALATNQMNRIWRKWPIESYVQLRPDFSLSPVRSDLETVQSNASSVPKYTAPGPSKPTISAQSLAKTRDDKSESSTHPATHSPFAASTSTSEKSESPAPTPILGIEPSHLSLDPKTSNHKTPSTRASSKTSNSPSCRSLPSRQLPKKRILSSSHPFRTRTGNMTLYFEIENPAQGEVMTAKVSGGRRFGNNVVDVFSLAVGEEKIFAKGDDENTVAIHLRQSAEQSLEVVLGWK
ncbi:hypothetical protein ACLMJK_001854 [Lecanora helva]